MTPHFDAQNKCQNFGNLPSLAELGREVLSDRKKAEEKAWIVSGILLSRSQAFGDLMLGQNRPIPRGEEFKLRISGWDSAIFVFRLVFVNEHKKTVQFKSHKKR